MPYIRFTEREREQANRTDLVRYLRSLGETVRRSGSEYAWEAPTGKVTIRGNWWYSQYEQTGGQAVDFVRKFRGLSFPEAVRSLLGETAGGAANPAAGREGPGPAVPFPPAPRAPRPLALPPPNPDPRRMYAYLTRARGIGPEIVRAFADSGLMYEEADGRNVCFVGRDAEGRVRHLHRRSCDPLSDFKGNVAGSEAGYAFHYDGGSDRLYVFEAPIDLLAFLTMYPKNWRDHSYASLCSTAGHAALRMLGERPELRRVYLCLDHDPAGIEGAYRVAEEIRALGRYEVFRLLPEQKDWDEDLRSRLGREAVPASEHPGLAYIAERTAELGRMRLEGAEERAGYGQTPADLLRGASRELERLGARLAGTEPDARREASAAEMARVACACCVLLGRRIGRPVTAEAAAGRMADLYRPHRDAQDAPALLRSIAGSLGELRREAERGGTGKADEAERQLDGLLRLGLSCLRFARRVAPARAEPVLGPVLSR